MEPRSRTPPPARENAETARLRLRATRTRGAGRWRVLRSFLASKHVKGELLVECARHEIAHAAALLFDEDEDHGPAWREHARRCGAREIPTLDEGDPMRSEW